MATKQLTVTAEEIQAWKTGKQDTIVSGTNATGTGNVVLAISPTLTGTPLVPTASVGTNNTQAASTAYVKSEITATTPPTVDISSILTNTPLTGVPTAPTAISTTNTIQLANTEFVRRSDKLLEDLHALGFTGKILPFGTVMAGASTSDTLLTQRGRFSTFIVTSDITITGVKFYMNTAGVYTANNTNGFCLYSVSAGTYTKITSSETLSANMWKTGGLNTVPFTTSQNLTPGVYKLMYIYSTSAETTAPIISTFCGSAYGVSITSILGNSETFQSTINSQTSFSTTILASTTSGFNYISELWLY
jgi:hypothetical protein